jgi:hypothetical protein
MQNNPLINALIKEKPGYSLFGYREGVYYPRRPFAKGAYIKNGEYDQYYYCLFSITPQGLIPTKVFTYPMHILKGTTFETDKLTPIEPLYSDLCQKGLIRPFQGYKVLMVKTYGLDHPCLDTWQNTELQAALDNLTAIEKLLENKKEFEDVYDSLLDAKDRIENVLGIDEEAEDNQ